jgi:hypothetical protein
MHQRQGSVQGLRYFAPSRKRQRTQAFGFKEQEKKLQSGKSSEYRDLCRRVSSLLDFQRHMPYSILKREDFFAVRRSAECCSAIMPGHGPTLRHEHQGKLFKAV